MSSFIVVKQTIFPSFNICYFSYPLFYFKLFFNGTEWKRLFLTIKNRALVFMFPLKTMIINFFVPKVGFFSAKCRTIKSSIYCKNTRNYCSHWLSIHHFHFQAKINYLISRREIYFIFLSSFSNKNIIGSKRNFLFSLVYYFKRNGRDKI